MDAKYSLTFFLIVLMPSIMALINCPTACKRCKDRTDSPRVIQIYCNMCRECQMKRNYRQFSNQNRRQEQEIAAQVNSNNVKDETVYGGPEEAYDEHAANNEEVVNDNTIANGDAYPAAENHEAYTAGVALPNNDQLDNAQPNDAEQNSEVPSHILIVKNPQPYEEESQQPQVNMPSSNIVQNNDVAYEDDTPLGNVDNGPSGNGLPNGIGYNGAANGMGQYLNKNGINTNSRTTRYNRPISNGNKFRANSFNGQKKFNTGMGFNRPAYQAKFNRPRGNGNPGYNYRDYDSDYAAPVNYKPNYRNRHREAVRYRVPILYQEIPEGCPTPPYCDTDDEYELMPKKLKEIQTFTTPLTSTTPTTTTTATITKLMATCPPITHCIKKRKPVPGASMQCPCPPTFPMCPCPAPGPVQIFQMFPDMFSKATLCDTPPSLSPLETPRTPSTNTSPAPTTTTSDHFYIYVGIPKSIIKD